MVWLFRFCKRPNGMEVGFSLLSLWLVVVLSKYGGSIACKSEKYVSLPPILDFVNTLIINEIEIWHLSKLTI
jgi:hypothetical protein